MHIKIFCYLTSLRCWFKVTENSIFVFFYFLKCAPERSLMNSLRPIFDAWRSISNRRVCFYKTSFLIGYQMSYIGNWTECESSIRTILRFANAGPGQSSAVKEKIEKCYFCVWQLRLLKKVGQLSFGILLYWMFSTNSVQLCSIMIWYLIYIIMIKISDCVIEFAVDATDWRN